MCNRKPKLPVTTALYEENCRMLLPLLRKIGFELWDPLGLRDAFEDGEPMADEYDSYLLRAFAHAKRSRDTVKVTAILKDAEHLMQASVPDRKRTATTEAIMRLAESDDAALRRAN